MFVTSSRALAAHAQKNDVLYVRARAREKVKIVRRVKIFYRVDTKKIFTSKPRENETTTTSRFFSAKNSLFFFFPFIYSKNKLSPKRAREHVHADDDAG